MTDEAGPCHGVNAASGLDRMSYIGRTSELGDRVSALAVERLAATLECKTLEPDVLPPLWHWLLFQDWPPTRLLGADGHPQRGAFLPPLPELPRRVWGGGRVELDAPLRIGEYLTRTSRIADIQEKCGKSGRFVVVSVEHRITSAGGSQIREIQHIVYREPQRAPSAGAPCSAAPGDAFTTEVHPDSVLLFRFSALTGNAHRIHYDQAYAREEGYPGLVVHGPLQAIWLMGWYLQQGFAATGLCFEYRAHRPAIAGRPMRLEGWRDGSSVRLRAVSAGGELCMSAEVTTR
jgi:3-methylfumaryl-CoA hydratase